jgi:hypothetical protein
MKKRVLSCVLSLAFAGLTVAKAEAQFCYKFTSFCDGIQVDSLGGQCGAITAQWYHYDCANNTPMTAGGWGTGSEDVRSWFPYRAPYADACSPLAPGIVPPSRSFVPNAGQKTCLIPEGCGCCGCALYEALITCENCGGFGDWYFVIDDFDGGGDGTLDMMNGRYPGGTCWIPYLSYNIQIGPCTTPPQQGDGPSQMQDRSTIQ